MSEADKIRALLISISVLAPLDLALLIILARLMIRDHRRWREQQRREAYLARQNALYQQLGRSLVRTKELADEAPEDAR